MSDRAAGGVPSGSRRLTLFRARDIGYQLYRIAVAPSRGLIALTPFDVAIVALTWREYRHQRRLRSSVERPGNGGEVVAQP